MSFSLQHLSGSTNPGDLAVKQIVGETILLIAVGIVTAFLNRNDASA